jgi:hypothetical protein
MLMLNSGLPQNVRSNRDLNSTASADRPLGVARNSIHRPRRNADTATALLPRSARPARGGAARTEEPVQQPANLDAAPHHH